jgi:hypothetical protein
MRSEGDQPGSSSARRKQVRLAPVFARELLPPHCRNHPRNGVWLACRQRAGLAETNEGCALRAGGDLLLPVSACGLWQAALLYLMREQFAFAKVEL